MRRMTMRMTMMITGKSSPSKTSIFSNLEMKISMNSNHHLNTFTADAVGVNKKYNWIIS